MRKSKFLKKCAATVLGVLTVLSLAACGGESTSSGGTSGQGNAAVGIEPMTIRVAGTTSEDSSQIKGLYKFKELVEAKTNGTVKVEVYPNLQLGSLREQAEAAQLGTIQMSLSLASTLSTFDENLQVLEYPYLWPTKEDGIWRIVDGDAGTQILKSLENQGFKGLGFWAGGFKAITAKEAPILSPDDLKGMNFRVIPSQTLIEQYKAWGANPVPIDFGELYTALQQGLVEGQENPLETIYTQKYHEVQEYLTLSNHGYQFHIMVANKNWFDGLSDELKQILTDAEKEAREYARDLNQSDNDDYLNKLQEGGMEVHQLTEEQQKPFIDLSTPLHEKLSNTDTKQQLVKAIKEAAGE